MPYYRNQWMRLALPAMDQIEIQRTGLRPDGEPGIGQALLIDMERL
jgi:hypothetical protein